MTQVTSPDNIPSPDLTDQYALTQDMAALADGTQAALVRRANLYIGTSTQRAAFTSAPEGTHWQDTDGSKLEYVRKSGQWVASIPLANLQTNTANSTARLTTQYGIGFITGAASASVSKAITFPKPFLSMPVFDASYIGSKNSTAFDPTNLVDFSPDTYGKGISPSLTGARVVIGRTGGANLSTGWGLYFSWRATGVLAS